MDEGRMKRFIPGRWKGEGGGVDRKRFWARRMPCGLHVGGKNNKLYSLRCWKNGLGYNSRKVENAWKDFDKRAVYALGGAWLRCGRNVGDSRLQEREEEFRNARNDDGKPSTKTTFRAFGWERWNAGEIA